MSLARSFNRMVAKATYDPELEKQLAAEKRKAREARTEFRKNLEEVRKKDGEAIIQYKLTPLGATQSAALFKTTNDWLAANPDATYDEIIDKGQDFLDKLSNIYAEDSNRLFFNNILTTNTTLLVNFKNTNVISEDQYNKCMEIVNREKKWLEKNPNESLQTYNEKIQKAQLELFDILKDPEIQKRIQEAQKGVKLEDNSKDLEEKKRQAEELAKRKEQKEKEEFNLKRLFKKSIAGTLNGFLIALILSFALLGGALAANEAVIRPLPYRILYFFYGFLFFPVVILYFLVRYFMGKPPYFASYLFPLYEYDPTTIKKDSFLQKLIWYKANPIIQHASKTFQEAADSVKDLQLDFKTIAAQIAKGE